MSSSRPTDKNPEQENLEEYILELDRGIKPFVLHTIGKDLTREEFNHSLEACNTRVRRVGKLRMDWLKAERKERDEIILSIIEAEAEEAEEKKKSEG